jgi:hypothetical protein
LFFNKKIKEAAGHFLITDFRDNTVLSCCAAWLFDHGLHGLRGFKLLRSLFV